jgi:hypothetical protein
VGSLSFKILIAWKATIHLWCHRQNPLPESKSPSGQANPIHSGQNLPRRTHRQDPNDEPASKLLKRIKVQEGENHEVRKNRKRNACPV